MRSVSNAGKASLPQLGQVVLTMSETVPRNRLKHKVTMPQVMREWNGRDKKLVPLGIAVCLVSYAWMEWRDQGILLSSRTHGETSAIIEVFTPSRGRHSGVVRGGTSRKLAPILQPGAQLDLTWRARLEDHIGTFTVEPLRSRAVASMGDRLSLAGLNAVTGLLIFCLPEREAHARLYEKTEQLLDLLGQAEIWPLAYLRWEMTLLDDMGFGLDLSKCAVLGRQANDLSFVSPRTGRAVSRAGAGAWADKLFPLPPCLLGEGPAPDEELVEAFRVTGHFLHNRLAPEMGNTPLPGARQRFVDRLCARAGLN